MTENIFNKVDLNLTDKTSLLLKDLNKREQILRTKRLIERWIVENENKKLHTREYKVGYKAKVILRQFVERNSKNYIWFFLQSGKVVKTLPKVVEEFVKLDNLGDKD